ncbi:MAG: DEAD/DEAH box helicase family protein [Spirochaeta sp.]|nr:DEAD/DEAH box helicase family protein [Spirochaeta sp.]
MAESTNAGINLGAIEPLYEPWEEPNSHRVAAKKQVGKSEIRTGRRRSSISIVQSLRREVSEWRENHYPGASDTTRQLFGYWFQRAHRQTTPTGEEYEFRYYFCQREAVETLVYLAEIHNSPTLSGLYDKFGTEQQKEAAYGIAPDEDLWPRYAEKIATGAGKTKIMSLAVVWSYFHNLRESYSNAAKHFVIIAPNLTVYERLREDFGDGKIFESDPLIPPEWRGDWNMSVVLQEGAAPDSIGGTIYLTNIHRLYDNSKKKGKKQAEFHSFVGPTVQKAKVFDSGAELRERIGSKKAIMVLNDEAHHVWDPGSAWSEAIAYLHDSIERSGGSGIFAQIDLSATPKDNKGQLFKHIICDTPLGEAVDSGIVKTPIIGRTSQALKEGASDNAAYRFDTHLRLGYGRWQKSKEEWENSGKKPLLFVMCSDTTEADQIAERLNIDPTFDELNGRTINLHTNLKGKLKKKGRGDSAYYVFEESEKDISDDDLNELRKLSRELDQNSSPYRCIVSVLMLREGWDVRNVTTIVPLRPYSSKANILPEQTMGRGLRRMTPPGSSGAHEMLTIVDHPQFTSLYRQELQQEGLFIDEVDAEKVPRTTVSIFPDVDNPDKDLDELELEVPSLAPGYRTIADVSGLSKKDIETEASKFAKLPLGTTTSTELEYEGRQLLTNEVVERMKLHLPLLSNGAGAISYYTRELEEVCRVRGLHKQLAPLLQHYFESVLFDKQTSIFDQELANRIGDSDVAEHVRAVFVPLIRTRITKRQERSQLPDAMKLSEWKPYQVTHSEKHPTIQADRTPFNLVPCNRSLELGFAQFADTQAKDVVAFAKNAGPQCLRIDYIAGSGMLAFYTPDFIIRTSDGTYYLVETKGREDRDVPRKARAAVAWCESASQTGTKWEYLYVQEEVYKRSTANEISALARACAPSLQSLLDEERMPDLPLFAQAQVHAEEEEDTLKWVAEETLQYLPDRYKDAVVQAGQLAEFLANKESKSYAPAFTALLGPIDDVCTRVVQKQLEPLLPRSVEDQKRWFSPKLPYDLEKGERKRIEQLGYNLKRTIVFGNGLSPTGLLRNCLQFALEDTSDVGGVFLAVKQVFDFNGAGHMLQAVSRVNDFRNHYVAHQENKLSEYDMALAELEHWVNVLVMLSKALRA